MLAPCAGKRTASSVSYVRSYDRCRSMQQSMRLSRRVWTTATHLHTASRQLTPVFTSVQNAAARLVTGTRRRVHITPVLQQLRVVSSEISGHFPRKISGNLLNNFLHFIIFNYNHIKIENKHVFLTNNSPDLCVLTLCIKFR